ncbi:porin [Ralstonia pseudosolanacearum]|uniref:porin n=1 Tax=Ralstonia pseudosolanacearum TaxID=1310165 RepID=UPI0006BDE7BA|nr:porin [Ralstonia pseudosolanacearum]AKZ28655.1 membrane protein [Ralstonia solanacearum]BCM15454.1 porin [Ralstonia solanacearum]BCN12554.1 porin [Ralstonia solanacearum]
MKKTLFAAAATACTLSSAAFAQSSTVTLYGVADAGVSYQSHVNGGTNRQGSIAALSSGGLSGSRWGIRGVEDLGGNLKGIFVLESGFDIDTGRSAQGNRLFGRQAYVGLQGDFGAITMGRQQNALFDLFGAYDPMSVAGVYSLNAVDNQFNGRADNALKYTGKFGGLTATGFYSFGRDANVGLGGEVPGSFKVGTNFGGGLAYANGALSVGAAYDQYQGSTLAASGLSAKRAAIGASYTLGEAKVFTGYRWLRDEVSTSTARHDNLYWLGAQYKLTPAFTLNGAAYYTNARTDSNSSWMFVLNGNYALSKRTDAYVLVGYVTNKGNATFGVTGTANTLPGQNQTGAMIGMRHRF